MTPRSTRIAWPTICGVTQCQQAIGRVKTLREDANVYRYDEKGDKVFFDAAARENSIAENQKLMRDLGCTPAIQP